MLQGNSSEFDGHLSYVQRGEIDTFAADITTSAQRLPRFDFTRSYLSSEFVVVSAIERNEALMQSLFNIFARLRIVDWSICVRFPFAEKCNFSIGRQCFCSPRNSLSFLSICPIQMRGPLCVML